MKTVSLLDTGTAEQPAYMEQHPVSQESGGGRREDEGSE